MPAKKHPVFLLPDDINVPIWRYMDFTKFVSMLEHGGGNGAYPLVYSMC